MKILVWDGSGLCLVAKRLESGKFVWPPVRDGAIKLSAAQLRLLLTGMDWTQIKTHEIVFGPANGEHEKIGISK